MPVRQRSHRRKCGLVSPSDHTSSPEASVGHGGRRVPSGPDRPSSQIDPQKRGTRRSIRFGPGLAVPRPPPPAFQQTSTRGRAAPSSADRPARVDEPGRCNRFQLASSASLGPLPGRRRAGVPKSLGAGVKPPAKLGDRTPARAQPSPRTARAKSPCELNRAAPAAFGVADRIPLTLVPGLSLRLPACCEMTKPPQKFFLT